MHAQSKLTVFSVCIGIGKLVDVKRALKCVNDWQSLGLELGLLEPTLEAIETDYHGKVGLCKQKMIASWLKQKDNVLEVGSPSWSVLKAALKEMGENEVADHLSCTDDCTRDECVVDDVRRILPSGLFQ